MAEETMTAEALLQREARQMSAQVSSSRPLASRLNAVWRQKVVNWYFTVVAALRRQNSVSPPDAPGEGGDANPFNRFSVYVTVSLLDNFLMSLPSESAVRYKRDRPAYQLLATTCLLLGMRLAQHEQVKEALQNQQNEADDKGGEPVGLKRAKTHKANMNEAPVASPTNTTPVAATKAAAIPNAATILRISAAPKSISEKQIVSMVREMTGSRSFPRSKVVTALDFIHIMCAETTQVSEDGSSASLGPAVANEAYRLADVSLRDANFSVLRPSVVAAAAITLALARSDDVHHNLATLRQGVYHSIFGPDSDAVLQASIRKTECMLLGIIRVGLPSVRNNGRVHTTHLIPLEDD